MTARIKPNIKADADKVRKFSILIDKVFPAMDGGVRRSWAEREAANQAVSEDGTSLGNVMKINDSTLAINGGIWMETYDELAAALNEGGFSTLRINSTGGIAIAGVATYQLVREAGLRVEVDGMAFSAAGVIAMGGDPIFMKRGSSLGIHRPWGVAIGNADEMREQADVTETLGEAMFEVYSARVKSKKKMKELRSLYEKDSLLTGEEAVALGLADEYEGDGKEKAELEGDAIINGVRVDPDTLAAAELPPEPKRDVVSLDEFRINAIARL